MIAALAVVAVLQAAPPPTDAARVALEAPQTVVALDTGKIKGEPVMLAWSPDGTELYLQSADRDRFGAVKSSRHYVVSIDGKSMKGVDQPPAWVQKYWTWKSAQVSPGAPSFKIDVDQRQETVRSTSVPRGGELARGGVDTGGRGGEMGTASTDAASAAYQGQTVTVYTLKLRGETLGEWRNEAISPGLTFGWAPAPMKMIAFAKRDGGPITLLDDQGHKQELAGTKEAVLPAWSDDGARLAWLEKRDRKHYDLMVAGVAARQ